MENEFIIKLNELLQQEDLLLISKEVGQLKSSFDDWLLHSEGKQQVETIKAKEKGETIEQIDYAIIKAQFSELFKKYKDAKKQQLEIKNKLELENLKLKKNLISELKDLVENEENIGTAFNGYNSIQDTWKKIGDIPRDKRDEIQKEYSRLRELFFHNITIYKELKENDYKRNTQLKERIIVDLQTLRNECESIRELEKKLRIAQDEWEDVGPVQHEQWEGLKSSYWEVVRSIYDKINKHYEQHRASQQENLKKKQVILKELKSFLDENQTVSSQKEWRKCTEKVLEFQSSWKKIGFAPKKDNDAIWKEFRGLCDTFFSNKKDFFKVRDDKDRDSRDAKRALIDKANELKSSKDWKEASHTLIQLQKQWKTLKGAGRYEKKLWEEFRGACDYFFNQKEDAAKALDKELTLNLERKQAYIVSIKQRPVKSDQDIKEIISEFQAIGNVASAHYNKLMLSFNKAIQAQLSKSDMSPETADLLMFKSKINGLSSSQDASSQYQRERKALRMRITELENELIKAETNMGYFSVSKGAEKLFAQVNQKNDQIKKDISLLKRKIKLIPNE
jgi:hypothetical protein